MRYERVEMLLRLALLMQGSAMGLSLQDIQDEFNVSRRTAERMRDAVFGLFPSEEVDTGERTKRWRIPPGTLNNLIRFGADELADLEGAITIMEEGGRKNQAESLKSLRTKIRALLKPREVLRIEPDLEALLEAEGLAMRPGPRQNLKPEILENLRTAIKGSLVIKMRYRRRNSGEITQRTVCPYGILYGTRHRLIAFRENIKKFRPYVLANIEKIELTGNVFEREEKFSLKEYASRSFGSYQEDPFDVIWRFSPEKKEEVEDFVFHPSQEIEIEPDGSTLVRFRAGGILEMAHHLFTWGKYVEIVEPKSLRDELGRLKSV